MEKLVFSTNLSIDEVKNRLSVLPRPELIPIAEDIYGKVNGDRFLICVQVHNKSGSWSNVAFSGQLEVTASGTQIIGRFTIPPQNLKTGIIAIIVLSFITKVGVLPSLYMSLVLLGFICSEARSKLGRETLAQFMESTLEVYNIDYASLD